MSLEVIAVLISGVAVVFSVIAAAAAHRNSDFSNQLQERLVKVEEGRRAEEMEERQAREEASRKAKVTAGFRTARIFGRGTLVSHNHGPAKARAVRVWLDGEPLASSDVLTFLDPRPEGETSIPADRGESYDYRRGGQDPEWIDVRVTRTDDSGAPGEFRERLHPPATGE